MNIKKLMLGNEAIARGAYEAGVKVAAGYPGTPSTEILEEVAKYEEIYTEWSVNEKVAVDVAIGASLGGVRSLVTMKHAGVNVASDPFVAISLMGVNGGILLVSSDDVGAGSSPTEQDTRIYAKLFHVPMLEPSDSQEAKDYTILAYELSERFDVPFFLRITNAVSHSKGIVRISQRREKRLPPFDRLSPKFRPQGGIHPTILHQNGFERLKRIQGYAEKAKINRIEWGDRKIGIISSGISYQYAKEVIPFASFLKLGMTYPLPPNLIRLFANEVKDLYIIEEMEPFLEEHIRAMGIKVKGSELRPHAGPLSRERLMEIFSGTLKQLEPKINKPKPPFPQVIGRFPTMCSGCPHIAIYFAIRMLRRKMKDKDIIVMGDIGCYSLGIAPPHNILGCAFAMGSGIGSAHGMIKALSQNLSKDKILLAYIGDSTFLHAGIQPLLNAVYNKSNITVIIANNGTTGMTGGQEHAGTGRTIRGEIRAPVKFSELCRSLGVEDLQEVDPYNYDMTFEALRHSVEFKGVSVLIATRSCVLFPKKLKEPPFQVLSDKCNACGMCLTIYCPSIIISEKKIKKGRPQSAIDFNTCTGCSFCAQICPNEAIIQMSKEYGNDLSN